MKKLIKLVSLICAIIILSSFMGCYTDSGFLDKLSGKGKEETLGISTVSGSALTNEKAVYWIGRTEYDETDSCVYTYYTATGFSVRFIGTELSVTYKSNNTSSSKNRPYFVVGVDNESMTNGTDFSLTSATQTVKVCKGLEKGVHTVTVLKRSEPENALTSITKIETDGEFLSHGVKSSLKFQIIGSSGISGHGALGEDGEDWTTENSSSLKGFGFLAASKFGAECQFVSASGMAMVWPYRGVATMGQAYDAVGLIASYNSNGSTKSVSPHGIWDHSKWTPDVIIANIGGNDWNNSSMSSSEEEQTEFKNAVTELLSHIHELYPRVKIFWTANSNSSGNGKYASEAISALSFNNQIYFVAIDNSKGGADNHASLEIQEKNAKTVADAITQNLGLEQIN